MLFILNKLWKAGKIFSTENIEGKSGTVSLLENSEMGPFPNWE